MASEEHERILGKLEEDRKKKGLDPTNALWGLLHQKPVDYWEYIGTDLLLNLQNPRTEFPDEKVFIMYHQVTELFFRMMRHELDQAVEMEDPSAEGLLKHVHRVNRYIGILTSSFDIMKDGMDPSQYDSFRTALAPASGFQSAQYRMLEFQSTTLDRLVHRDKRDKVPEAAEPEDWFDELYWQEAGKDPKSGKKSPMLSRFEEKYRRELIRHMRYYAERNLRRIWKKLAQSERKEGLSEGLRTMDKALNVDWPLVHLRTAEHYLESGDTVKSATGGSPWKRYLHPAHQRRIFFPELWSEKELENWGKDEERA